MIETTIIKALEATGVPVYAEAPAEKPKSYIVIQKTGSSRTDRIDRATVAVQSISAVSLYNAALLNDAAKAVMLSLPDSEPEIFASELNSDYNFTNQATKEYRYQAVFNIVYKE